MEMKHTPGPWAKVGASVVEQSTRKTLAVCTGSDTPTVDANARLMALAPQLLKALKDMVDTYRYEECADNPSLLEALAVIEMAEGGRRVAPDEESEIVAVETIKVEPGTMENPAPLDEYANPKKQLCIDIGGECGRFGFFSIGGRVKELPCGGMLLWFAGDKTPSHVVRHDSMRFSVFMES